MEIFLPLLFNYCNKVNYSFACYLIRFYRRSYHYSVEFHRRSTTDHVSRFASNRTSVFFSTEPVLKCAWHTFNLEGIIDSCHFPTTFSIHLLVFL